MLVEEVIFDILDLPQPKTAVLGMDQLKEGIKIKIINLKPPILHWGLSDIKGYLKFLN